MWHRFPRPIDRIAPASPVPLPNCKRGSRAPHGAPAGHLRNGRQVHRLLSRLGNSFEVVSCIELTDPQCRLLTALTNGPRRVDDLDAGQGVLDELCRWGWVVGRDWIELTGARHYHAAGQAVGRLVGRQESFAPGSTIVIPSGWDQRFREGVMIRHCLVVLVALVVLIAGCGGGSATLVPSTTTSPPVSITTSDAASDVENLFLGENYTGPGGYTLVKAAKAYNPDGDYWAVAAKIDLTTVVSGVILFWRADGTTIGDGLMIGNTYTREFRSGEKQRAMIPQPPEVFAPPRTLPMGRPSLRRSAADRSGPH